MHTLFTHVSMLHVTPSLHSAFVTHSHAVASLTHCPSRQVSAVHAMPSLQLISVCVQVPLEQRSVVQASPSSQSPSEMQSLSGQTLLKA